VKLTEMKPDHDPSRTGDIAEYYAVTWLWDNGYQVFKNCGCSGPVDLIALDPNGKIKLFDVKSYKDSRLRARSKTQKQLGVEYIHYNPVTRKCKFVRHRK